MSKFNGKRVIEAEAMRVELECLRGLAIRAWHSFRSGLTAGGGCHDGLTDADIEELVRLANAANAKNRERDALLACRQGDLASGRRGDAGGHRPAIPGDAVEHRFGPPQNGLHRRKRP